MLASAKQPQKEAARPLLFGVDTSSDGAKRSNCRAAFIVARQATGLQRMDAACMRMLVVAAVSVSRQPKSRTPFIAQKAALR